MLLPSALPCDPCARPTLHRAPAYTISSPPRSPPSPHFSANIFSTCRALHSLLGVQAPPVQQARSPRTKVEKRKPTVPRGVNKRRRDVQDTGAHSPINDKENIDSKGRDRDAYSTPKRQRLAPPSIPLGLERRDFYALQPTYNFTTTNPFISSVSTPTTVATQPSPPLSGSKDDSLKCASDDTADETADDIDLEWTSEDDSELVDLVLDKLRLSKWEWDECARVLGTDGISLGRRWKELVGEGGVGLRFRKGGRARADIRKVWKE